MTLGRDHSTIDEPDASWQRRIQELYTNVAELYSHVDITVVVFDRDAVEVSPASSGPARSVKQELAAIARRVIETGEAQRDVALDGSGRQRAHGYPLRQGGDPLGAVCVIDDDGARRELFVRCAMAIFDGYRQNEAALLERERRALEEAKRANRQRDQFLAVISHELRSPLSAILLWEQVLRDPSIDLETRTSALDVIHESATGQALLVADLLDVSRAINGKLHIDLHRTSLTRMLSMAIENARQHVDSSLLDLSAELDPELGDVLGDTRRLRQIFDNLLSNAIKSTRQGQISIHAAQDEHSITIQIRDTGRGIAADALPHIFDPFWQADHRDRDDGLGLGLAIARQLTELHGGSLSATSDGLGRGATFRVRLPRPAVGSEQPASALPTIAGIRILVVDDDPRILDGLHLLLRQAGAIVTTARSAATAYRILEQGQIDIVLSDIAMAAEDGYSLMRRVRALPNCTVLPAIAITGLASEEDRSRAFAAGFDRHVPKPIDVPVLISTIAQLAR